MAAASFRDSLLTLGSATAGLIVRHDWSATPLGEIETWQESLRVVLGMVLRSPVPMVVLWGEDGVMLYNDAYSLCAGERHPHLLGAKVREGWPEVAEFNDNVMRVGLAGGTLAYRDQELTLGRHGRPEQVWMNLDYSPVVDESGKPAGVIAVVVETTERVLAERRQRLERDRLELLNRTAARIASELDLGTLVQTVTDAGVELTGARFGAFFYNIIDKAGERYTLYSLSGADRSAFEKYPMPRATAVFGPTFRGEGVIRSEDIRADPRYGRNHPNRGMPEGHLPVRSYLAVPVVSRTGEVLGGLFFGHPEPGVFTEAAERVVVGLAGQAASGIDNARLFQATQRANETLETRVAERTRELREAIDALHKEVLERQQAEEALRQAQKMEAVGQLTGGIAHDFNNLLQAVAGSLDLIRRTPDIMDRVRQLAEAGLQAAERGAKLTGQLLTFSRAQRMETKPVVVADVVANVRDLLDRTLGPLVTVRLELDNATVPVLSDATQLEVAVLNLAINARDAMPGRGELTIRTRPVRVANDPQLPPGEYVELSVSDTGTGMPPEVVARAFEPFFTTKEVGKGTGLGLSQVYGLARQSGGTARIESAPGHGTTVRILLPRTAAEVGNRDEGAAETELPAVARARTVLVVDDDSDVRGVLQDAILTLGHRVEMAASGEIGLAVLDRLKPDVLLLDYAMPGMTGAEVARAASERRPGLPIIFASGYSDTEAISRAVGPGMVVLRKPFRVAELKAALDQALAAPPAPGISLG